MTTHNGGYGYAGLAALVTIDAACLGFDLYECYELDLFRLRHDFS